MPFYLLFMENILTNVTQCVIFIINNKLHYTKDYKDTKFRIKEGVIIMFLNKSSLQKQYENKYGITLSPEQTVKLNNISNTFGFGFEELSYVVDNYPVITPDDLDKLDYVCFNLRTANLLTLEAIKRLILPKGKVASK